MTLAFGLGKAITVNEIIGLPTIREWKQVLDVDTNRVTLKLLDLSFQHAASEIPQVITFTKNCFVQTVRPNSSGQTLVTQLVAGETMKLESTTDSIVINIVSEKEDATSIRPTTLK